jgi:hypothetical protein
MKKSRIFNKGYSKLNSFSSLPSFFILSLSLAFASAAAKEQFIDQKIKAKYLFIIVANGVRYNDAFGDKNHLYTEYIWTKLRPFGTICANFYNTKLTYPIPAQASLLTGVWHVFENPVSATTHPVFPTLFEYWKKTNTDKNCYFAANKKQFAILAHSDHREYGKTYAPVFDIDLTGGIDTSSREAAMDVVGNAIYSKAVSYIFDYHPFFVYLNLDADSGGEGSSSHALECRMDGCNEEAAEQLNTYYESIILADTIVYDLWNRIQRDEIYKDKSIFIFLSTHGRHTDDFHGFGDNCRGCRQLNFFIIGPGVKTNFISKKKRTLIDVCPTLGALCDLPVPHAKGEIMKEILE